MICVLAISVFASSASAQQMQVQRCEGKDGKVTYSNRECPAGTSPVRKVNTAPPVSVPEQKAAKDRAKKDAAEVKQLEKDDKKQVPVFLPLEMFTAIRPKKKLPIDASAHGVTSRARSRCATQ